MFIHLIIQYCYISYGLKIMFCCLTFFSGCSGLPSDSEDAAAEEHGPAGEAAVALLVRHHRFVSRPRGLGSAGRASAQSRAPCCFRGHHAGGLAAGEEDPGHVHHRRQVAEPLRRSVND